MAVADEFEVANKSYVEKFDLGHLAMPPVRKVAVLTCMDARLDPTKILGLVEGDAHVIRNAGGRATDDALRSLIISEQLLGTEEIVVIHHTDCGMLTFTNDSIRQKIRADLDADASEINFLPFTDLVESVKDDIETIEQSPLIPNDFPITGYIYEVQTGQLIRVEA